MKYLRSDLENFGLRSVLFVFLFFSAHVAYAQVVISEIMYDPQGGDTGHEWVEIVNQGSASVDLTQSKFVEGSSTSVSNHGLVSLQGGTDLLVGAYAIIADDAQTFLSDHVGFSGVVLDSSFSLSNTGETIEFKMPDGTISDTISYTKDMGAYEDGNSLQKINGAWRGAVPTPGVVNASSQDANSSSSGAQLTTSTTPSSATSDTSSQFDTSMYTRITVQSGSTVSGAPITFLGEAVDSKKKPIDNAYYLWTFGDGETGSGKTVAHIFRYPGNYIVTLDSSLGALTANSRIKVAVSSALLRATLHDTTSPAVDISNEGTKDIDLSSWIIEGDYRRFTFPEHTMLLAGATVTLASETTGFRLPLASVRILYPNGSLYEEPKKETPVPVLTPTQSLVSTTVPVIADSAESRRAVSNEARPEAIQHPEVSSKGTVKAIQATFPTRKTASTQYEQTASVADAFALTSTTTPPAPSSNSSNQEEGSLWPWYIGAAFFAVLALLGLRLTREKNTEPSSFPTADDFEIIEELDDNEPH